LPGARLSSRSTPVRRRMVFAGGGLPMYSTIFDAVCGSITRICSPISGMT
jgi:hypothetical protein